jgi:hypothetical protein
MVFHSENLQCPEVSENGVVDEQSCLWVQSQVTIQRNMFLKLCSRSYVACFGPFCNFVKYCSDDPHIWSLWVLAPGKIQRNVFVTVFT